LALVGVYAFFVAAEFAIVKVRPTRIEELLRAQKPGAHQVRHIIRNIDAYLSACQLGITMASLGLGWVGEPAFARLLSPVLDTLGIVDPVWTHGLSATAAFTLITFLHITVGEQAPKSLSLLRAEALAMAVAYPLRIFYVLAFPGIWLINNFSLALVRLSGVKVPKERRELPSEEEFKLILAQARSAGLLSVSRSEVLRKAMSLPSKTAKHLMVPRNEAAFLDVNQSLEENLECALQTAHTRFPLCNGQLDEVIGIVDIREVLFAARRGKVDLRALAAPPVYLPELMSAERVLAEFRARHIAMAVIVDEYGGAAGILTAADVVSAVVGEFDDGEDDYVVALPGGVFDVEGTATIEEVEEALNVPLPAKDMRTVAGFVMHRLGRMPRPGDRVVAAGHVFNVISVSGPRIDKVRIQRQSSRDPAAGATAPPAPVPAPRDPAAKS
jgi:CBS domain containing-hemolysin-like protein